jgi:DNA-3-methyladenine glycosylase I
MNRCKWVNLKNNKYIEYHDTEWGVEVHDDNKLFELLLLESFQAGLSWECILNKREEFRTSFDNFNPKLISKYDDNKIKQLLNNTKIIRNRNKIEAAINNAKIFLSIQEYYGSFDKYIWSFTNNKVIKNTTDIFTTTSKLSDEISNDLRKKGMKYTGSVIIYSYLQAIGVIDDHELNCFKY